jgi:hypothetical protein
MTPSSDLLLTPPHLSIMMKAAFGVHVQLGMPRCERAYACACPLYQTSFSLSASDGEPPLQVGVWAN